MKIDKLIQNNINFRKNRKFRQRRYLMKIDKLIQNNINLGAYTFIEVPYGKRI